MGESDPLPALRGAAEALGLRLLPLSAHSGEGLLELRRALAAAVRRAPPLPAPSDDLTLREPLG